MRYAVLRKRDQIDHAGTSVVGGLVEIHVHPPIVVFLDRLLDVHERQRRRIVDPILVVVVAVPPALLSNLR